MSTHPSLDGTGLSSQAYAEHLAADLEALLSASGDLGAAVPGCPGWTVRDLLSHVVGVYRHKIVALQTDAEPVEPADGWGAIVDGQDPRAVLREEYERLRDLLAARDADAPTWSWWPAEQTVGFWQRRMAHETAIHRWDAQSALDGPDGADPVPDGLASDGVDELLGWLAWPWDDDAQPQATGQQVLVSSGEHAWTLTFSPTRVQIVGGSGADAVALLAAEPSGLLLHVWGRPGEHGVASGGDAVALDLLRQRLTAVGS